MNRGRNDNVSVKYLVAELSQLLLGGVVNLSGLLGVGKLSLCGLLAGVVCGTLDLSSLLESIGYVSCRLQWIFSVPRATHLATTSWYFHPTSWLNLPTVQYLRPGFSLSTLRAWGTTTRLTLSYGGGTPSKTFSLSIAAAPRAVL